MKSPKKPKVEKEIKDCNTCIHQGYYVCLGCKQLSLYEKKGEKKRRNKK
jgi:hypothetical protein